MGNNPMVGMTVAVAVSIEEAAKSGNFQVFENVDKLFLSTQQ